jgi:hypothetical protein
MYDPGCSLCLRDQFLHVYYEDEHWIIVQCRSTQLPLCVSRKHFSVLPRGVYEMLLEVLLKLTRSRGDFAKYANGRLDIPKDAEVPHWYAYLRTS